MPEQKKRGCLFYGCSISILVFIAVAIGLYFGTKKAIQTVLNDYTSEQPAPLPRSSMTSNEIDLAFSRVVQFASNSTPGSEISLTADEINALIETAQETKELKDRVFLQFETNKVKAQISLPLSAFGAKQFGNRYLNGTALLDVAITNGVLTAKIQDLVINGKSLPSAFISRLEGRNLLATINEDPKSKENLRRIESLELKDNKVQLRLK